MPAIGDIIQITSCKDYLDETVCNVFYYAVAAWTGNLTLAEVLDEFIQQEHAALSPLQQDAFKYGTAYWRNLTVPAETADFIKSPQLVGLKTTGDVQPSFAAYSVRLFGFDNDTRSGYKRFGGVTEGLTNAQVHSVPAPDVTAVESFLENLFTTSQADDFLPVIVGRDALGGFDLTRINTIVNAVFQPNITTQNTRKAGRGI